MHTWTEHEFDILETMTRKIKLMAEKQLIQIIPIAAGTDTNFTLPIDRLLQAELLLTTTINARPLSEVPFIAWKPDDESPDFDLVWQRVRGDCHQSTQPTRVYWAAPQTANLFGVRGGLLSPVSERGNDLRLAAAFVKHHALGTQAHWLGPTMASKCIESSRPADAAIVGLDGGLQLKIAVARGDAQRLREFHDACVNSGTAYEVW